VSTIACLTNCASALGIYVTRCSLPTNRSRTSSGMMSSQQYPSMFSNASLTALENLQGCAVDSEMVYVSASLPLRMSLLAACTPTAECGSNTYLLPL